MNPIESKTNECLTENSEFTMIPAVDVQTSSEGVCLKIDLPGVDKEHLTVHLEKQNLTIHGDIGTQDKSNFVLNELAGKRYEQSFTLSTELDTERISASFQDGVLTLTLPKKESLKPRKIEVKSE